MIKVPLYRWWNEGVFGFVEAKGAATASAGRYANNGHFFTVGGSLLRTQDINLRS